MYLQKLEASDLHSCHTVFLRMYASTKVTVQLRLRILVLSVIKCVEDMLQDATLRKIFGIMFHINIVALS